PVRAPALPAGDRGEGQEGRDPCRSREATRRENAAIQEPAEPPRAAILLFDGSPDAGVEACPVGRGRVGLSGLRSGSPELGGPLQSGAGAERAEPRSNEPAGASAAWRTSERSAASATAKSSDGSSAIARRRQAGQLSMWTRRSAPAGPAAVSAERARSASRR